MTYPLSNDLINRRLLDDMHIEHNLLGNTPYFLAGGVGYGTLGTGGQTPDVLKLIPHLFAYAVSVEELYLYLNTPASTGNKLGKIVIYHNVDSNRKACIYPGDLAYESPDLDLSVGGLFLGVTGTDIRVGPGYVHFGWILDHTGTNPVLETMAKTNQRNIHGWDPSFSTVNGVTCMAKSAAYGAVPDPAPNDMSLSMSAVIPALWVKASVV